MLLVCAVAALTWANSPWADTYEAVWGTEVSLEVGGLHISKSLLHWINDALMAVFFFVVGLEIKREVLVGELASFRRAAFPIVAAVGGMAVPAAVYMALNVGGDGERGWGIPMATDIAFALGVLALLARRIPLGLRVFLAALAIADDMGAVLVVALFYTESVVWTNLLAGGGLLVVLVVADRVGVRHPLVYALLGVGVWLAFLESGVHATVAGVAVAMAVPSRARINTFQFLARVRLLAKEFEGAGEAGERVTMSIQRRAAVEALESAARDVETPLQRMEHHLHPWVAFVIMPLFALANAGVSLGGESATDPTNAVTLGVLLGLVAGKQVGITLFAWLAVRSGLAALPEGVTWRQVYGVAWLGGIGFTMSLFITGLAFGEGTLATQAKVGVLVASAVAGAAGWLVLRGSRTHLLQSPS